ncbi:universal stress protein [Gloeomargarita lithophora Alchichica-D10]|uniref:Universal stress protein n=1 Tax=Gloeomargarita lithophora Alchichica-D10 TaxID=1188229 RepID=A0A1J0ABW0_9CYAN|nr:universal stress protein [Gloeomargarita lithophora]APB33436.1 universal stress protein [Gloeomargarita lithophora Alchichica-D10]
MFHKVLLALDPHQEPLEPALALVTFCGASLTLLAVVPTEPEAAAAETWLGTVQTALQEQGMAVAGLVRVGQPAFTICDWADEMNADLIIVGCRGTGLTEEGMAESVSIRVINLAPCPVLVIP